LFSHTVRVALTNPNLDSNIGKEGNHAQDVGNIIQTQTQNPRIIQSAIQEIKEFLNEDYTGSDHLSMYESKREEELPTLFLPSPKDYKDIKNNSNSLIKYNAWHPRIAYLRCIRLHIINAIRLIAKCMLRPHWRKRIDKLKDDIHYYFYFHCHLFCFLDSSQAIIFQGFSHNCIYVDKTSWIPPYPIRMPFPPKNALLSVEEDEFLCHVAESFEFDGRMELVNNIRYIRDGPLFMNDDTRILFEHGYLDPLSFYNKDGQKRAMITRILNSIT
jgi:hypothetical protein